MTLKFNLLCRLLPGVACLLLAGASSAEAGFLGSAVTGTVYAPDLSTVFAGPATATVGAGVEFAPLSVFDIDISDTSILMTSIAGGVFSTAPFNGDVFQFAGAPDILSVSVDPSSTFIPSAVSFSPDEIFVNVSGVPVTAGQFVLLDVTLAAAPEPGSTALVGAGLLGIAVAARKFRKV